MTIATHAAAGGPVTKQQSYLPKSNVNTYSNGAIYVQKCQIYATKFKHINVDVAIPFQIFCHWCSGQL